MGAFSRFAEHARGIAPPDHDQDPRAWRWNVFWSLLILSVLLITHLLAVHGGLEGFGVSRSANASEMSVLDERSKAILRVLYAPQIRAKVRERCDAKTPGERERVNVELGRLKKAFKDDAGEEFGRMPTCSEV